MSLTFIDFFAGIGGGRRGLEMAGHKCVGYCEIDKFASASYRMMHTATEEQRNYIMSLSSKRERKQEILKEEYLNGEYFATDITKIKADELPRTDLWIFGAPCQDFSIAGKRKGLNGDRSSLIREIFRLLRETREENRPQYIIYENVKGMLSSNRGFDFLTILTEMDEIGYDAEWQLINSSNYVPQNRERVYIIGHLRIRGRREIFPIPSGNGKNTGLQGQAVNTITTRTGSGTTETYIVENKQHAQGKVRQIGTLYPESKRNKNQGRIYDIDGIAPALNCMEGGNRQPFIVDSNKVNCINLYDKNGKERPQQDRIYSPNGIMPALTSQIGGRNNVAITGGRIRKLTPRECFRLQGWGDEYFDRAAAVNSDTRLYKQAGNGMTVNVVYEIGKRME